MTDNKWVFSIIQNRFKIPFKSVPPLSVVLISLSQSSSPLLRERLEDFSRNRQWKGYRIWELPPFYSQLFWLVPKKKGKLRPLINLPSLNQYINKQHFKMETSQVSKTIDNCQRLGCLHRFDGCISSCTDTSDIQKILSVRLRTSGLSVHGLTLCNVPKPMVFH